MHLKCALQGPSGLGSIGSANAGGLLHTTSLTSSSLLLSPFALQLNHLTNLSLSPIFQPVFYLPTLPSPRPRRFRYFPLPDQPTQSLQRKRLDLTLLRNPPLAASSTSAYSELLGAPLNKKRTRKLVIPLSKIHPSSYKTTSSLPDLSRNCLPSI